MDAKDNPTTTTTPTFPPPSQPHQQANQAGQPAINLKPKPFSKFINWQAFRSEI